MNGLAFAIVGHLMGDYLLQNDWMAVGKKKSTGICAIHCLIWTISVVCMSQWMVWWVPIILFATHFAQDRTGLVRWYMDHNGQSSFATDLAPWSIIVVDNVLHLVVIAIIAMALGIKA